MPSLHFILEHAAVGNDDALARAPGHAADAFAALDAAVARDDLPEDAVPAVQVARHLGADEELRAVRVGPGVGH